MTFEEQQNKIALDNMGISYWHDGGQFGVNGLSATFEVSGPGGHGEQTMMVHNKIAPSRGVVVLPGNPDYYQVIRDKHVDVAFRAFEEYSGYEDALIVPPDVGFCTIFHSSGNAGPAAYNPAIDLKHIYGVGMVSREYSYYIESSIAKSIMFTDVSNLYIGKNGVMNPFYGTSCSAPLLAGKAALVNSYFFDCVEDMMNEEQMIKFLLAHCKPLYGGWNTRTGFGVVILPEYETINIRKWLPAKKTQFFVDAGTVFVDGQQVFTDQPAYITAAGRTVVPLRFISEQQGCDVAWDDSDKKNRIITITE